MMNGTILIEYLKAFPSLWVSIITVFTGSYLIFKLKLFRDRFVTITLAAFLILLGLESIKNLQIMYFNVFLIPLDFALSIAVIVLTSFVFLNYKEKESVFQVINLDVKPEDELFNDKDSQKELKKGYFYLIESQGRDKALKMFRQLISQIPGLCFSREHPIKLKDKYDLTQTPVFWFSSESSEEKKVNPTRLSLLRDTILKFVQENEKSAILVLDLEYLFYKNNFRKGMHMLEDINNNSTDFEDSVLIFSIDPSAMEKRELSIIEDEFDQVIREEDSSQK